MKTALSLIVLVITITMGIGISCVSHASGKDTSSIKGEHASSNHDLSFCMKFRKIFFMNKTRMPDIVRHSCFIIRITMLLGPRCPDALVELRIDMG